uniref:Amidase domain-containing protein n=1 Tax=Globodera rostochiensis TaxID=31243 RepID=A0A914I0F4_GLORO
MLRYKLIQTLYPLLTLIALLYYALVNRVFSLISRFLPKGKVTWSDEEAKEPLLFMSAKKAAEKIRRKELSSTQLVTLYIARLQRVQPLVNAVVMDNFEAARAEAEAVDLYMATLDEKSKEFQMLAFTKPLLGVPFTFKNNMDAKGFVTVAGFNKFLNNAPAEKDSKVMERLRSAGAIPVAITNLPKLAMNWCVENEVFGRTVNPYDVRRTPGGSSGGDSAAVSAGAALFGIGNDLAGSVRIPSAMCGIFGLKPTKGAIPLDGFVPPLELEVVRAQWSIGPLCRYAEDLPAVFAAMAGKSLSELSVAIDVAKSRLSETRFIYMDNLNIWFVEKVHDDMRNALRQSVHHFEKRFDTTAQKVDFPLAHHLFELWGVLGFGEPTKNVSELAAELPKFIKGKSEMTCCAWVYAVMHSFVAPRSEHEREFALHKLDKLRAQLSAALGDNGLLLLPPWPTPAPFHRQNVFTPLNMPYTQLFNVLGFPALVCPVGLNADGVPLSVQLVAPYHGEPLLMAAAQEMENAFGGWNKP